MRRSPSLFHGLSLCAVTASMACMAAPALAQTQQTVGLGGEAEQMCTLGEPTVGTGAFTNFDTPSGTVFSITQLANATSLTTRAASITLSLDAMCNTIHRVVIASDNNGLWRQGVATPARGFGSAVPFRANLSWASQQYALTADATIRQGVEEFMLVGQPNTGEMEIEFEISAGATNVGIGAPLLAGEYSDVLRVTLEPQ